MNRKVSVSIILIVLVIILAGVAGYLAFIKNPTSPTTTNKISLTSTPIKETLPTTSPTLEKVISYDLKFDVRDTEVKWFDLSQDKKYVFIRFKNKKNNKYYIQINNQTYGPYDYDDYVGNPQFSNDSSKYGWTFGKDCTDRKGYKEEYKECNKYYIQINNQTYGPYDDVYNLKFSNDSSKYGWTFGKDCTDRKGYKECNKYYIQINNQTYGPYKKAYFDFTFSEDNKVYIIYIKDNKMIIEKID